MPARPTLRLFAAVRPITQSSPVPPPPFPRPSQSTSTSNLIPPSSGSSSTPTSLLASTKKSKTSRAGVRLPDSPPRTYTQRKSFLYAYYDYLLRKNQVVLLFRYDNVAVPDLDRLRGSIKKVPLPKSKLSSTSDSLPENISAGAKLTITRTGVLAALARTLPVGTSLEPWLQGQTALLTIPTLTPIYISDLLKSLNRAIRSSRRPDTSGKPVKQPSLSLVAGVLEGNRLMGVGEIEAVAKLNDLDTLRGQVVGILEGQGRGLVGLLNQAGGGGLVRTLQGLEKDLGEKGGEAPSS